MSNLSTLEMRDNVVNWYKDLSDEEKVKLLEKFIFDRLSLGDTDFLDGFLTPIYCKLNKIILE